MNANRGKYERMVREVVPEMDEGMDRRRPVEFSKSIH